MLAPPSPKADRQPTSEGLSASEATEVIICPHPPAMYNSDVYKRGGASCSELRYT